MLQGEHEALLPRGPYVDPYLAVDQFRAVGGNINNMSEDDQDDYRELLSLETSTSPTSEPLECASSSRSSRCSLRSFSPHTPSGTPPSPPSSSAHSMFHDDTAYPYSFCAPPSARAMELHGSFFPPPHHATPVRPWGLGLLGPVIGVPSVSYFKPIILYFVYLSSVTPLIYWFA